MPDAAEVVPVLLELLHLDHFGKPFDALDEGILDRLSQVARKGHELRRVELLVPEKDDLMLEQGLANVPGRNLARQIDAEKLGAEGSGNPSYLYCSTLMFWLLMIEP